jgi:hypothetical protein
MSEQDRCIAVSYKPRKGETEEFFMINKEILEKIQNKFESNPSLIRTDIKFALVYMTSRMIDNTDTYINALDAILTGQVNSENKQLKLAWKKFMDNAELPEEYR